MKKVVGYVVGKTVRSIARTLIMKKIAIIVASVSTLAVITTYSVITIAEQLGTTISVGTPVGEQSIILSETHDFAIPKTMLVGPSIGLSDTTYSAIPPNINDLYEGAHPAERYVAYTFFIANNGTQELDYQSNVNIIKNSQNLDDLVRVMVITNGQKEVYAKLNPDSTMSYITGTQDTYRETFGRALPFKDKNIVCSNTRQKMYPNEIDKITIVIWIEGWDDDGCYGDSEAYLGGTIKFTMDFEIIGD